MKMNISQIKIMIHMKKTNSLKYNLNLKPQDKLNHQVLQLNNSQFHLLIL